MITEACYFVPGDLLIHDGEPSLCTEAVQSYLSAHSIYSMKLPSALHAMLSPCDNNFHSLFKLSYYRMISEKNYTFINLREKLLLAKLCYDSISSEVIAGLFRTCGLVGSGDKRLLVSRLMCEGLKLVGNRDDFHRNNLIAFLKWCLENNLPHLCPYEFDVSLL